MAVEQNKWTERMIHWGMSIVVIVIGSWILGITDFKENIATKDYVNEQVENHEKSENEIISSIREDVTELKEADTQIRIEFLEQIKMLREDLRLKKNKD